jgi:hypothetical protein
MVRMAEGENAPIVPTAEGVREARNRYVAIDFPEREAAPPALPPVAAAPPPAPPPPPPKWAVSLGPWYGHNLDETNAGVTRDRAIWSARSLGLTMR